MKMQWINTDPFYNQFKKENLNTSAKNDQNIAKFDFFWKFFGGFLRKYPSVQFCFP